MIQVHKPRLNEDTWSALLRWQAYIQDRTGRQISVGKTVRYLATGKLTI